MPSSACPGGTRREGEATVHTASIQAPPSDKPLGVNAAHHVPTPAPSRRPSLPVDDSNPSLDLHPLAQADPHARKSPRGAEAIPPKKRKVPDERVRAPGDAPSSQQQQLLLGMHFARNPSPSPAQIHELADSARMTVREVEEWMSKRRSIKAKLQLKIEHTRRMHPFPGSNTSSTQASTLASPTYLSPHQLASPLPSPRHVPGSLAVVSRKEALPHDGRDPSTGGRGAASTGPVVYYPGPR